MAQDNVNNETGTVSKVTRKPAVKTKAAVKTVAKPKAAAKKVVESKSSSGEKESAKPVGKAVNSGRSKAAASKANTSKRVGTEGSGVKKATAEKESINVFAENDEKDVSSGNKGVNNSGVNSDKESNTGSNVDSNPSSLGDKIKSATKNIEDKYFSDTGFEKLYDYTEQLSDKTRANLKHWNNLLNDTNEMLMDKFFEKSKELREYATKKPVSALLISTGIGVALYKAFKRR